MSSAPYGILHTEHSTTSDGTTTTLVVEPHYFAGHGRVDGVTRWTVYRESAYRPRLAYGTAGTKARAIAAGRKALQEWHRKS